MSRIQGGVVSGSTASVNESRTPDIGLRLKELSTATAPQEDGVMQFSDGGDFEASPESELLRQILESQENMLVLQRALALGVKDPIAYAAATPAERVQMGLAAGRERSLRNTLAAIRT